MLNTSKNTPKHLFFITIVYTPLEAYVAPKKYFPTSLYYAPEKMKKESSVNVKVQQEYCFS